MEDGSVAVWTVSTCSFKRRRSAVSTSRLSSTMRTRPSEAEGDERSEDMGRGQARTGCDRDTGGARTAHGRDEKHAHTEERMALSTTCIYAGFAPGAGSTQQRRAVTDGSASAGESAHLVVRFRTRPIRPAASIGAEPHFAGPTQIGISVAGTSPTVNRDRSAPSRSIHPTPSEARARYGRQRHLDRRRSVLRLPAAA